MCRIMLCRQLKDFPHSVQLNGFSPVWILMCICKERVPPKHFPQTLQISAVTCVFRWTLKPSSVSKCCPHTPQTSLGWTSMWFTKETIAWKAFPQSLQEIRDFVFLVGRSFGAIDRQGLFFFFFHVTLMSPSLWDPMLPPHSSSLRSCSAAEQLEDTLSLPWAFVVSCSAEVLGRGSSSPLALWQLDCSWSSSSFTNGAVKMNLMVSSSSSSWSCPFSWLLASASWSSSVCGGSWLSWSTLEVQSVSQCTSCSCCCWSEGKYSSHTHMSSCGWSAKKQKKHKRNFNYSYETYVAELQGKE